MEGRLDTPLATNPTPSSSLPADDGMESLRQKMREIHNLATSTEDKARKMHLLMTRDYQEAIQNKTATDHGNDTTEAWSKRGTENRNQVGPSTTTKYNPYNIEPDDLIPSHCPEPVLTCDEEDNATEEARFPLGCQHYSRNVKIQCYDCHLWFPCRHCHDNSSRLPFPHQLNRQKTENMLCMHCQTPQPAGETCIKCNAETAYYYCPKCKLWDNDSTKRIYHCDDCGICRRGEGLGKDYVHCKRCNVCISISTSQAHPCIERATDCDCPLCLDYLFSSQQPVVSLLCGHYMHAECYKDLMRVTYRCPVCNKSAVNMELQWRKLDDEIRFQPMPEEDFEPATSRHSPASSIAEPDVPALSSHQSSPSPADQSELVAAPQPIYRRRVPRKVWIGCNDCGGRGYTPFHWLGLRCPVCDGYNTAQTNPHGDTSTSSLRAVSSAYHQRRHDFTGVDAIRSFGDGSGEGAAAGLGVDEILGEEARRTDSAHENGDRGLSAWPAHLARNQEGEWVLNEDLASGRSYFFRAEMEENATNAAHTASHSPGGGGGGGDVGAATAVGGAGAFGGLRGGLLRPDRALSASASEMFGGVPYEMVMRLGRSLSPMRYYIDGLDMNAAEDGTARAPSADAALAAEISSAAKQKGEEDKEGEPREEQRVKEKRVSDGFWGSSDGRFIGVWHSSDENDDDEDEEDGDDDEEDDEQDSDDDSEDSADEDEDEDDDEDDEIVAAEEEEHLLPGHM